MWRLYVSSCDIYCGYFCVYTARKSLQAVHHSVSVSGLLCLGMNWSVGVLPVSFNYMVYILSLLFRMS